MEAKEKKNNGPWIWRILTNWSGRSPIMLRAVERKILSFVKTTYRGFFVDIGPAVGETDKIWTISFNEESKEIPLVLLHGFGSGVALWLMNFDALSKERPLYAMDVLGFGRSSRPKFSTDPIICEKQFVKSVEEWRREMKINNMILLGHSMGGFIASSYTLAYPDRVKHLILADPWGFPEKPSDALIAKQIPFWVRAIGYALTPWNPLWALRAAGPLGQALVEKMRPDIVRKFSPSLQGDDELLPKYIHQCNVQSPSGEAAFHTLMESFGWAKHPMVHRIKDVRADIPITFIYGSRSWLESSSGEKIKTQRGESLVDIKIIPGAGHHVYADKPEHFNRFVNETCNLHKSSNQIIYNIREATESDEEHDILNQQQPQHNQAQIVNQSEATQKQHQQQETYKPQTQHQEAKETQNNERNTRYSSGVNINEMSEQPTTNRT